MVNEPRTGVIAISLAVLLDSVLDHLIQQLSLADGKDISCQIDAQPPPFAGEQHIVVHPTSWTPGNVDPNDTLDERFGISVSVTRRTSFAPVDRRAKRIFIKRLDGIERLCRRIVIAIHLNYDLQKLVRSRTEGDESQCEPLRWEGTSPVPRLVTSDWFHADGERNAENVGWVMTNNFGSARRLQAIIKANPQSDIE